MSKKEAFKNAVSCTSDETNQSNPVITLGSPDE